jgi:hypothetical protein
VSYERHASLSRPPLLPVSRDVVGGVKEAIAADLGQEKAVLILEITVGTKINSIELSTTIYTSISDERTF